MKNFLIALLAGLSFVCLSAVAEAGKQNGTIIVKNNTQQTLIVSLSGGSSGNSALLSLEPGVPITAEQQTQFNTSGGRTVNANGSTSFTNLTEGTYTLTAAFVTSTNGTTSITGTPDVQTVFVKKGQTVTVTYTNGGVTPNSTVSPSSAARTSTTISVQ